ncbi:uncharacterized protein [Venturia canescens]|nr:uncharacterized protein LOC122418459 isoform X2 [Venturia canescens]
MAKLLHRPIRAFSFPEASTMGLFFALAVPLEAPRNSVSLSYFFEATYNLPQNSTDFEPHVQRSERKRRGIQRKTIYHSIQRKFERSGLRGRECLLRVICETSESPLHHNGVLGDIISVIFTPSTSRSENLPRDMLEAELVGRGDNCSKYYTNCPVGLFDLIGILV